MTAPAQVSSARLPAVRLDPNGNRKVDLHAVVALAIPLFVNSSIQALLNLTDTWFIGRLSTDATAAVGAGSSQTWRISPARTGFRACSAACSPSASGARPGSSTASAAPV